MRTEGENGHRRIVTTLKPAEVAALDMLAKAQDRDRASLMRVAIRRMLGEAEDHAYRLNMESGKLEAKG